MSNTGTTVPGRAWVPSKAPNFVTQPAFTNEDLHIREASPDLFQASIATKYKPQPPGDTIFTRTLNTYKKRDKPGILKGPEGFGQRKNSVAFSINSQDDSIAHAVVTANTDGGITVRLKPYEEVINERDALIESDNVYRNRIKQLEEVYTHLLLDYEGIHKENNILRDKLDRSEDNYIESYQRVHADRQILREAESAYKRRITKLEHDAKEMLSTFESVYGENTRLRNKSKTLEERLNSIDRSDDTKKINVLERKCKLLEKNVRTLGNERDELLRMNNTIDNQMYKLREEIAEFKKINMLLEKENEDLKRGFRALGQNVDTTWRDDIKQKTRRQEEEERNMREEHAQFKKDIAKLNKELHTLEKVHVEMKTRNDMLENDKTDFQRRLFELANENGKRTPSGVKRRNVEASNLKDQKLEEMAEMIKELKNENDEMKTKNQTLEKEKETFEKRFEEASTNKRETASSIRRKLETEREIRDLNMHVENLNKKVKRIEVENDDLKDEMKRIEIEAKSQTLASKAMASEQSNQRDVQIQDLNEKVVNQTGDINTLTEENLKLKMECNNMEEKLQAELYDTKKANANLLQEKEFLQNNVEKSTSTTAETIQALKDQSNSLYVELQLLRPKHEDLQTVYDELKTDHKSLTKTLENKGNELEKLKENLRDSEDIRSKLLKSQRENALLGREIDGLEDKFEVERLKLEEELEELHENQEFMNTALAENKVRLDMLQQEKNEFKSDNIKLVKANERQSKTISDLQTDIDKVSGDSSTKASAVREELEIIKKELKKSETGLVLAKQEIEIAKNERENQVSKLLKQMDKLTTEREIETRQLNEQSVALRAEVARLKIFEERIQIMEGNFEKLVQKLQEVEVRNKDVTTEKLLSLQQVVQEMKSENLANRIRAAEREQNELEKYKMELEIKQDAITEIRKLKKENSRLLVVIEDKRAAEEAQDEWTRKKSKFNEIIAQNKRLQEENTRLLAMSEGSQSEHLKKDIQAKDEKLKLIESKYHEFTVENANLRQAMEEKEKELNRIGLKVNRITRIQHENRRIMSENQRLRDDMLRKDNVITSLKELETAQAKYMDSATNNQRLYDENMRLRDTIEKSRDYKSEFTKARDQEKSAAAMSVKYQEDNTLLRNTLQVKEAELRREIELQKDRANNITARNKRLIDELAKLKIDINKKNDLIIKLRELETAEGKLKDASLNATRLYEENQRLRNLLEMQGGGWKNNFHNAKSLSATFRESLNTTSAIYVESNNLKRHTNGQSMLFPESAESEQNADSPTSSEEGHVGKRMKIKPLTKLPEITKEDTGLVADLRYSNIIQKTKGLKGDKLAQALTKELKVLISKLQRRDSEIEFTKAQLSSSKPEYKRIHDECDTLKSEVARLKKEIEIMSIGESMNRNSHLQQQNNRFSQENHRLRNEINARDIQLANHGAPGYIKAHYVDSGDKSTEEKLSLSMAENIRLNEANNRLRAALDAAHQNDTGSRFKDSEVTGAMIEGFNDAKSNKWASMRADRKKNKEAIKRRKNETDDNKLMKLEELAAV